ncbi:reverse transcriptase domain-containing protein [Tanacetum coccineum]
MNNNRGGCTYKEFLACDPKEYDEKGGAIVYTRWIEKMESVQDMSGYKENQKIKYTAGSFFGKALMWWNSQIHTRSREDAVGMSWEDFKNLTREEFCLVNEMQKLETELVPHLVTPENKRIERNGSLKKNPEKRGNDGYPNKDRNVRDENKRTRNGYAFATTTNSVRREYNGTIPKCVSCNLHHLPEIPYQAYFNYSRPGHMEKDFIVAPRMVDLVNAGNLTVTPGACYECGGTDHFKATCPRLNQAQMPGETVQTKLLLIIRDKVLGTTVTRNAEGRLC